jgi:hypothetical protein
MSEQTQEVAEDTMRDALSDAFDQSTGEEPLVAVDDAVAPAPAYTPAPEPRETLHMPETPAAEAPVVEAPVVEEDPTVPLTADAVIEQSTQNPEVTEEDIALAPGSWVPIAREDWAKIPEAARKEIWRLDKNRKEIGRRVAEGNQFKQMLTPYEPHFASIGMSADQGVSAALQMAAVLISGPAKQKAEMLSQMIKDYGVDIGMLDDMIVGQMPAAQSPEVQAMQGQIDQLNQYIQNQQQGQHHQVQQQQSQRDQEVDTFIANNEFANDLRIVMADFIDMAERQPGGKLTLEQAYQRAIATRPDIQQIIAGRTTSESGANALSSARRAATSVPQVGGATPPAPANQSTRAALLDAWDNAG